MEEETSFSLNTEEATTESVLETLRSRGWSLEESDNLRALVQIQTVLSDDRDAQSLADAVEAELLNLDLRTVGSKSLPDLKTLSRKISYLTGPKVLQVLAVRDLSVSKEEGATGSSNRRLLRFVLTDGKSEIVAVEFIPLRCITTDVVPGTKVRLENKVLIRSGIVCLDDEAITLLGGVVQTLYDEWQMNRKYSGFLRSSLRLPQQGEYGGPPPFEKLRLRESSHLSSQATRLSEYHGSTSKSSASTSARGRGVGNRQIDARARLDDTESRWKPSLARDRGEAASAGNDERPTSSGNESKSAMVEDKGKVSLTGEGFEKVPSPCEIRPREVAEAIPVQNQEAAQKLLQKMNNSGHYVPRRKGRKHRGVEKPEQEVLTLDEWEMKKTSAKPPVLKALPDNSHDEDLAWQLQNQLDMEDSHVQRRPHSAADELRQSMFNYGREADTFEGVESRGGGRGRRGRGRGRGERGRGRGRGRGRSRGGFH